MKFAANSYPSELAEASQQVAKVKGMLTTPFLSPQMLAEARDSLEQAYRHISIAKQILKEMVFIRLTDREMECLDQMGRDREIDYPSTVELIARQGITGLKCP